MKQAGKGRAGPGNFSEPEGPKPEEVSAAANAEWRQSREGGGQYLHRAIGAAGGTNAALYCFVHL